MLLNGQILHHEVLVWVLFFRFEHHVGYLDLHGLLNIIIWNVLRFVVIWRETVADLLVTIRLIRNFFWIFNVYLKPIFLVMILKISINPTIIFNIFLVWNHRIILFILVIFLHLLDNFFKLPLILKKFLIVYDLLLFWRLRFGIDVTVHINK